MKRTGVCAVIDDGRGAPRALLAALERRSVTIQRCRDVFDAMTEMVLHERAIASQATAQPFIVVLVEPGKLVQTEQLARAASIYAPHVGLWQYEDTPRPRLQAYVAPQRAAQVEPVGRAGPQSGLPGLKKGGGAGGGPSLRLAGWAEEDGQSSAPLDRSSTREDACWLSGGDSSPEAGKIGGSGGKEQELREAEEADEAAGGSVALTQEELSMLLSDDWGETEDLDEPEAHEGR